MYIITDLIRSFLNAKQKENESLQQYTRRFKFGQDIMESQIGGPIILKKYIKTMPEYVKHAENKNSSNNSESDGEDNTEKSNERKIEKEEKFKRELIKISSSRFQAYVYLKKSYHKKYNAVIKTLNQ